MKRFQVNLFSCVVAAVLIPLLLTTAVAQAQAAPWTVVSSPSPGVTGNELLSVASVSANDVWAVGEAMDATGRRLTLTEHWNGTAWSVVPSPNAGSANNSLSGVAAVSTTDVWAVGQTEGPGGAVAPPLIEHWNGTSWSFVKVPRHIGVLNGITAVATNDVWAVGDSIASGVFQTLIEHWNGHTWRVVSSPNASTQNNFLNGVTAVSASDIWAVGDFLPAVNVPVQTLTLHWNGTAWSVVSSPNVGSGFNTLQAAAAVSTNAIWAVGQSSTASGAVQTLIEEWNGTAWSVIASPSAGELRGVAIVSANDIWAVGSVISSGVEQTVIEQWNGASWSVVSSPNPSASLNILGAAAANPSSGQAWAVGEFFNTSSILQTLTEFNP